MMAMFPRNVGSLPTGYTLWNYQFLHIFFMAGKEIRERKKKKSILFSAMMNPPPPLPEW
jgi:hypothetical protein